MSALLWGPLLQYNFNSLIANFLDHQTIPILQHLCFQVLPQLSKNLQHLHQYLHLNLLNCQQHTAPTFLFPTTNLALCLYFFKLKASFIFHCFFFFFAFYFSDTTALANQHIRYFKKLTQLILKLQ